MKLASEQDRIPSAMLPLATTAFLAFWALPTSRQRPLSLYTSDVCVGHNPGDGHPERPARLQELLKALRNEWVPHFGARLHVCEPARDVTTEQIRRVHTKSHCDRVDAAFAASPFLLGLPFRLDSDTIVRPGTQAAAKRAAGLVVAAVDDIFSRDVVNYPEPATRPRRAFVMVRPPGHHAEANGPQGFCLYNNVMIGVAHAQAVHGLKRVAILDFDVHHGNGDADVADADPSRLYVSSHEVPNFPGTGEERGRSGTHGNVVSAPLPAKAGSGAFRRVWSTQLLPAVRAFRPEGTRRFLTHPIATGTAQASHQILSERSPAVHTVLLRTCIPRTASTVAPLGVLPSLTRPGARWRARSHLPFGWIRCACGRPAVELAAE